MKDHITKENILKYAAGLLSPQDRKHVEEHLDACTVCLAKTTHSQVVLKETCARVQNLLTLYHDNTLTGEDFEFVRKHLAVCDRCLEKYHELAEKTAAAGDVAQTESQGQFDNLKSEQDVEILKKLKSQYKMLAGDGKTTDIPETKQKSSSTSAAGKKKKI